MQHLEEDAADVPELIERSLRARFGDQQPSVSYDDHWIQQVWNFLARRDLNSFSHLILLPEQKADGMTLLPLHGVYVCSSVKGMAHLSPGMASCLTKLGVVVLPELPDYVARHTEVLGRWVHYPSTEGLLEALKRINDDVALRRRATECFNASASTEEKGALAAFMDDTADKSHSPLEIFYQLKLFTEVTTNDAVSVGDVSEIAPDVLPPVRSRRRLLLCSPLHRRAAIRLGATETTLQEVVSETVELMKLEYSRFSDTEITTFMKFVLGHEELTADTALLEQLRPVSFVPTSSGQLKLAEDLYDPASPVLQKLFSAEEKFPSSDFMEPNFLKTLKALGLKGEEAVRPSDVTAAAELIQQLLAQQKDDTAREKAEGLSELLAHHGLKFDTETLRQISDIRCFPCLLEKDKPEYYPRSLPFSPSSKLARPKEMCFLSQAQIAGSVLPVIRETIPSEVAAGLQVGSLVDVERVLQNMDNILTHFQAEEAPKYKLILNNIFRFLHQHVADPVVARTLAERECVLTEYGDRFAKPGAFWIETAEDDIQLKPYRFLLPNDLQNEKDLFKACGSAQNQDTGLLRDVLLEIKDFHSNQPCSPSEFKRDFQLVKQILDVLNQSEAATDGTVLLPVCHSDPSVLHFQQAKDCTVVSTDGLMSVDSFDDDTEIFMVHPEIQHDTAVALGALKMKDRALTGIEDLDFGYEQREELTTRLQNLLKDSYTDGFSVPKELIQNADDAGATEVRFLLDERENDDARKNLITDNMASLQGPAFWAYNDATFSDSDFENIIKFGAGTKKADASKVGRFGLGFNSVYNLTDVPSFISRHTMAMFDPHVKHLKGGAGLKLDFRQSVNRALLSRMPQQFKPFQGVFGCRLQNDGEVHYNGTLFRFPLRTAQQAADSRIKNESYSESKRREFLRMLLEKAGNLLLFTQSVQKLKVFHLSRDCTDPSSPQCLLSLTKTSHSHVLQPAVELVDTTILQYFTTHWFDNTDIRIIEDVHIEMTVTQEARSVCEAEAHNSSSKWRLAWASGVDQSAKMARENAHEGLVPLATAAALLGENAIKPITDSPPGFCKTGHLFCFLPLPETMVLDNLLVHVNATFALTSSRRSLLVRTEDDLNSEGAAWNSALIADAVSRAYLLLLENVQNEAAMDTDFKRFFELWPVSGEPALVGNFYRRLVTDGNKVLPVPGKNQWVVFCDTWFLESRLRCSQCGEIALKALQHFWGDRDGSLTDVPVEISSLIQQSGHARVISELEFFQDIFFPNISSIHFKEQGRDKLVSYALVQQHSELTALITKYPCIPCASPEQLGHQQGQTRSRDGEADTTEGHLKRVTELYHPECSVLRELFATENMFPCGEFIEPHLLDILQGLGLRGVDAVTSADVIRTAELIQELWTQEKKELAQQKAEGLWKLLISHGHTIDNDTLRRISTIQCLPCLQRAEKPERYPGSLPFGCSSELARPDEMCQPSQALVVGSVLPTMREGLSKQVIDELSVGCQVDFARVLEHLDNIIKYYDMQEVFHYRLVLAEVFGFFGNHATEPVVAQTLREKRCVLTVSGVCFAKPDSFWVESSEADIDLKPYRYPLPHDMLKYSDLFRACGASRQQDAHLLQDILVEIQSLHTHQTRTRSDFDRDLQLVKMILDVLKKRESNFDGSVLLPIHHSDPSVLRFQQAKDCTVMSGDGFLSAGTFNDDDEIFIVHPEIHHDTAVALGALKMKDRALTGIEDLDFGYEQREELTSRLQNLLKDSYTDGFSVPKELIQNADDAGATEVCFLLDERENEDARQNLITDGMASFQGPAFWAYNDATFSDSDFENIIKLGAGTKKADASKVGRFGLGFNSVYNLTDVPSFISRHTMAMFDPHVKHLKGGAGLKLDFRQSVNRALLSRMPQQFKPFQGVFGCRLQNDGEVHYNGTLFRFPLRTAQQAADSRIKNESYSESKRREFLKMLLERAGSLLMFTQNINKLKVLHLPRDSTDPSSPLCLLDLTKTSHSRVLQPSTGSLNQTILQYFTSHWSNNADIKIVEDVKIEMTVTPEARFVCEAEAHSSSSKWRLAWASGVDQSADMARQSTQEGLIPMAAVSALIGDGGVQSIKDSPPGFYSSGHIFCFLPLPENMVLGHLNLHVNATFALSSSRRSLLARTEDDLNSEGAAWNSALIADAVSRAYLLLLENVQNEAAMETDFRRFFDLWPTAGDTVLMENFYSRLVTDQNKVLPVPDKNHWVSFLDAWFLESTFRSGQCGEIAWKALQHFWNKDGYLVDVPSDISAVILKSGHAKMISVLDFFTDTFFPNIASSYFKKDDRDQLVLYALTQRRSDIDVLIRQYPCISCTSPEQLGHQQDQDQHRLEEAHTTEHDEGLKSSFPQLKRAEELYHPDCAVLRELFATENMFPCGEFIEPHLLDILQGLGLRGVDAVTSADVIRTAELIQELWTQEKKELAQQKAEGLWKLLISHGHTIDNNTLRRISTIQCLPCLQRAEKPERYPGSLPFGCSSELARPDEMCQPSQALVVGSVLPTMREGLSKQVIDELSVGCQVDVARVFKHLDNIISHYDIQEVSYYRFVLAEVFHFFGGKVDDPLIQSLQGKECVLTEDGVSFARPDSFWVERSREDIDDLRPYRHPLPRELSKEKDLFMTCGAHPQQNTNLLRNVLIEIQRFHDGQTRSESDFNRDFKLVRNILDVLKRREPDADGSVLLPISHTVPTVLHFRQAKDCTVISGDGFALAGSFDDDEEIFVVHRDIHQDTAVALGALKMKDRALTGVEDLDFGYEQREELTSRLHSLLKDSYTDGFSVPKELIQNADDAGATEVCFLLDERENEDARQNLITDDMASFQGPAFWAYNDATFSDSDFENITKLGAGTKKEDTSKVGRFGLGFNSVYNLTDVPSFISRHTMAMFDPHVKHLKGGAGLKLDFRRPVNRALLSRMPQQFKPFQGVFGCRLQNDGEVHYDGTLFRFPLRTPEQAADSRIKNESYSEGKRREFLRMLLERVGSLLMFTQNIHRLKVFHIPRDCTDPSSPMCLLDLTKTSNSRVLQPLTGSLNQSILQYFTSHWSNNADIKIVEDVKIEMTVTQEAHSVCEVEGHTSTTHWRVGWASGIGDSAKLARKDVQDGLVPLAGVAAMLNESCIKALNESPPGFYKSGHLFCFLPLPDSTVRDSPAVHINATFALASSRRSLLVRTEDDLSSEGAAWNSAVIADAVSRAYILLLENLQSEAAMDTDLKRFFELWPVSGEPGLVESFYRRLVSERNKILPVPGQPIRWVSFEDAWFLEPAFRDSECGAIAWKALQNFMVREGHLVDIPVKLCSLIKSSGQAEAFKARVISEQDFYTEIFFPKIDNDYWEHTHRDRLILRAVLRNCHEIDELLKEHPCIPCHDTLTLRRPRELIHPKGNASVLYLPSDGRFPQGTHTAGDQSNENFCSETVLDRLAELGMTTDDLPWEMVVERAASVSGLLDGSADVAHLRAGRIVHYLSSYSTRDNSFRIDICPPEVKETLSHTSFLPVLNKPADWPFPWASEEAEEGTQLAAPCVLFSDTLKDHVACEKKIMDLKALAVSVAIGKKVLQTLGVQTMADPANQELLELAIRQLQTIAQVKEDSEAISSSVVENACKAIYSYLSDCVQKSEEAGTFISSQLSSKAILWTGDRFVDPTRVAFKVIYDCRPYRFRVEPSFLIYKKLFQTIGVKETFDVANVASLLEQIHLEFAGRALSGDMISLVSRAAQLLCDCVSTTKSDEELDSTRIFLPDRHGNMLPTCNLCVDDCPWLKETDSMKFVNYKISVETAQVLGVKTKRRQDFESMIKLIPFGQEEKLTDRINGLLEGYTFDSSLFKELLQNADDAGATEIKFIKDMRHLGREKVLEGCDALQGPALCVFNDKSFTKGDMEGIQNLGRGSKWQDSLKTGQYGVGFNAVYHITDVPSFWTLEDDVEEAICILDPNCQYIAKTTPDKPGVKLTDVNRFRECYPDMFAGYLGTAIDMTKPGTLFRFPLRTEEMATKSEIKKEAVTMDQIVKFLDDFKKEMSTHLLFLNNLKKIGVYSVKSDGRLEIENEVSMELDENCIDEVKAFNDSLLRASESIQNEMKDIITFEACATMTVKHSQDYEEQWLTVHRVGFDDRSIFGDSQSEWNKQKIRLLPRGGVAVKLAETSKGKGLHIPKPSSHQAFCILPLPVFTNLPMHVNGHFALDHETRRGLWDNRVDDKPDVKTKWNEMIASHIIVPAYITALERVKHMWFHSSEHLERADLSAKLRYYHSLFPDLDLKTASTPFWTTMRKTLYKQIAARELSLFPSLSSHLPVSVEWIPAVSSAGFAGYFNNLEKVFNDDPDKPINDKRVVLSQGGVQQSSGTRDNAEWARQKAERFKALLKRLNMKVLEAPYSIFKNFTKSDVNVVLDISPETVVHFLKSSGSQTPGRCNINELPQPVTSTPLETPADVLTLLNFIKYQPPLLENLQGLPLCLRQSGNLYFFCETEDLDMPIVTGFFSLLTGSSECFVHEKLVPFFLSLMSLPIQRWIKVMDIPTLVRLLPRTLPMEYFKTGQPCSFDVRKLPSKGWLKTLWEFLKESCPAQKTAEEEGLRQTEDKLHGLMEWSLLPVKLCTANEETLQLYPIKDMHKIVFLTEEPDRANEQLWCALKELYLPFLNTEHLPASSVAKSIVASIGRPLALLKALYASARSLEPRVDQARPILFYFNSNLPGLGQGSEEKEMLLQMLKRLPLYPRIDGKLTDVATDATALCLDRDVPNEGLVEWASEGRCKVVLLKKDLLPVELCMFLEFATPTTPQFYYQYLLPTLGYLHRNAILSHMLAIKRGLTDWDKNDKDRIIQQLVVTEFLVLNNELRTANAFYSPHVPVFRVMGMTLPPSPYCGKHWESFMKSAGMISEVSQDMFVDFARVLQEEGGARLGEETKKKSKTMMEHLFFRRDLNDDFLEQLRDIRFVLPSPWMTTATGQVLCRIAAPYCTDRLVSFGESCTKKDIYLVWSNRGILHDSAEYAMVQHISEHNKRILACHFGLQGKFPRNGVIQHVQTVCRSLAGDVGKGMFGSPYESTIVKNVMVSLYRYLQAGLVESEVTTLRQLEIICDVENKQMLKPENVVVDLREEEAIRGRIVKAPVHLGEFFEFFKRLGAAERVTADHYAKVLSRLKQEAADNVLHVEEMKLYVQTAVRELFKCLRSDREDIKRLTVEHVYLPSENGCLVKSTHLAFIDDVSLRKRFPRMPQDMQFFIGFKRLEIMKVIDQHELKLLPDEHQVQLLSRIVKEVIPEDVKRRAAKGQHSREIEQTLKSPEFADVVVRLAYCHHKKHARAGIQFTEETAQNIIRRLAGISVLEAVDLKTMLMWKRTEMYVDGSERSKTSFVDKCSAGNTMCTLYLDKQTCDQTGTKGHAITQSMKIAVLYSVETELNTEYLMLAIKDARAALAQMDEDGLEPCDFNAEADWTVFPPPGTFIPVHLHCYLDNSFESFYNGEHVGFEVYDPQVDELETEENVPVYIYAIVIEEVEQEGEVPLLAKRYRIDLGPERGETEASVTQLYKFVRKPNQGTPRAVVIYEGRTAPEGATSAAAETSAPLDFKAVMKEIRKILTEAWQNLDERGCNRVVKRLYLKWHPDKNRGNEIFCTRVVQRLQHYVELLKQGRPLPDDEIDDEDYVNGSSGRRQPPFSSSSAFFENMNRRGREYSHHFEDHSRSSSGGGHSSSRGHGSFRDEDFGSFHYTSFNTRPNPQPGEGRRWFRQAEADLGDACAASERLGRGYNWICFLCQQVRDVTWHI